MPKKYILTLDLTNIGTTSLYELRDTLAAEFDACKDWKTEHKTEGIAVKNALDVVESYLADEEIRRPVSTE